MNICKINLAYFTSILFYKYPTIASYTAVKSNIDVLNSQIKKVDLLFLIEFVKKFSEKLVLIKSIPGLCQVPGDEWFWVVSIGSFTPYKFTYVIM
jgi:hypothetical protein